MENNNRERTEEKTILSSASYYKHGYFFNDEYSAIPDKIKRELRVITVYLAENTGGISILGFYKDSGDFYIEVSGEELDVNYDEINAQLELNKTRDENAELFSALSLWYRTFILKEVKI